MTDPTWNEIDSVLLRAVALGRVESVDYPADVVKNLLLGYISAGFITQTSPGVDRYRLTLTGRSRLASLIAQSLAAPPRAA